MTFHIISILILSFWKKRKSHPNTFSIDFHRPQSPNAPHGLTTYFMKDKTSQVGKICPHQSMKGVANIFWSTSHPCQTFFWDHKLKVAPENTYFLCPLWPSWLRARVNISLILQFCVWRSFFLWHAEVCQICWVNVFYNVIKFEDIQPYRVWSVMIEKKNEVTFNLMRNGEGAFHRCLSETNFLA